MKSPFYSFPALICLIGVGMCLWLRNPLAVIAWILATYFALDSGYHKYRMKMLLNHIDELGETFLKMLEAIPNPSPEITKFINEFSERKNKPGK